MNIRRILPEDLSRLRQFWVEYWGADFMVVHGQIYRPEQLDGFIVEEGAEWIGLVTFSISNHECEITSLDSLHAGKGIGTTLINKVVDEAHAKECQRIFLITTNDNLNALGFYQRRGFERIVVRLSSRERSSRASP